MARVAGFIKSKRYNIAKSEWLKRALGSEKPISKLIKFKRDDMIFATESLAQQFDTDSELLDDDADAPPLNADDQ